MSITMNSSTTTLLMCPPIMNFKVNKDPQENLLFGPPSMLQNQPKLPKQYIWPHYDLDQNKKQDHDLQEPLIDLQGFLRGDDVATACAAGLIKKACKCHGFFQVTNHGVDAKIIEDAYGEMDAFFKLPFRKKLGYEKKPDGQGGYSSAHSDRFTSKLPWKETFSFGYRGNNNIGSEENVVDHFKSFLGNDYEHTGRIFQKYCDAMNELSLVIMELLAISLGVKDRFHYRKFFEDNSSLVRWNYYPSCMEPSLTLGTGPHCDPTSLTILHQDQVGGLQVFANNKWQDVKPQLNALVINIGDTFTALSNGMYKSCLHRAVVNSEKERRSIVFFVNPKEDKVVRPPKDIVVGPRKYPDFTWSQLLDFTQKHYRADAATLQTFVSCLLSSNPNFQPTI